MMVEKSFMVVVWGCGCRLLTRTAKQADTLKASKIRREERESFDPFGSLQEELKGIFQRYL
eukprot:scaffold152311_cov46-Cyclotella_meneghiniana.AAC.1